MSNISETQTGEPEHGNVDTVQQDTCSQCHEVSIKLTYTVTLILTLMYVIYTNITLVL